VSQRFHKKIYVFGKRMSEKMLMKKMWNHIIELKKEFVLRKEKVCTEKEKRRYIYY